MGSLPQFYKIKIIEVCRDIGLSHSGFYQPSFRNGAKMHLQMLCLGKIWNPVTRLYKNRRSDGSLPPPIPEGFKVLGERAIQDSYILIENDRIENNPEDILPRMNSDICIVNFYTESRRLGLHQDKDESERSLHKGLPVISFSIGDPAEFLYGDERDTDKAQRVVLESGDVLLFGVRLGIYFMEYPPLSQIQLQGFLLRKQISDLAISI